MTDANPLRLSGLAALPGGLPPARSSGEPIPGPRNHGVSAGLTLVRCGAEAP